MYSRGVCQVFSSIRHFRDDLTRHPPDYFICVPLVLDTLHSRVRGWAGGRQAGGRVGPAPHRVLWWRSLAAQQPRACVLTLQSRMPAQVEATLKKASAVRRTLALGLLAAAAAYVWARRVVDGVALQYAVQPRPLLALVQAWLALAALTPLNWLFQRLVAGKVRAALGIRRCVISGGGSLAAHLDTFYESIGLPVLNGWGLTETSPVLACRRSELNVRGSVGESASSACAGCPGGCGSAGFGWAAMCWSVCCGPPPPTPAPAPGTRHPEPCLPPAPCPRPAGLPTPGTEVRVVDPATLRDVPDGQQGLILARGPGVMAGYFNDVSATAKVRRSSGRRGHRPGRRSGAGGGRGRGQGRCLLACAGPSAALPHRRGTRSRTIRHRRRSRRGTASSTRETWAGARLPAWRAPAWPAAWC